MCNCLEDNNKFITKVYKMDNTNGNVITIKLDTENIESKEHYEQLKKMCDTLMEKDKELKAKEKELREKEDEIRTLKKFALTYIREDKKTKTLCMETEAVARILTSGLYGTIINNNDILQSLARLGYITRKTRGNGSYYVCENEDAYPYIRNLKKVTSKKDQKFIHLTPEGIEKLIPEIVKDHLLSNGVYNETTLHNALFKAKRLDFIIV